MAINQEASFPTQITPGSPDYPWGSARDDSTTTATDGTPLLEKWLNDFWGFTQALLKDNNINPSGDPDTAQISQYLEAIRYTSQASDLSKIIKLKNDISNPNTHITAEPGVTWDSTFTIPLRNITDFTKDLSSPWLVGDGNGGVPSGVTIPTNSSLHYFEIRDDDGTIDFGVDDQLNASKLLSASGYSVYKRLGSIHFDGSSNIIAFHQFEDWFYFDSLINAANLPNPGVGFPTDLILKTPLGVTTKALLFAQYIGIGAANSILQVASKIVPAAYPVIYYNSNEHPNGRTANNIEVLTDLNSTIEYGSLSTAADLILIDLAGYKEYF
jgi:hypothetical protein